MLCCGVLCVCSGDVPVEYSGEEQAICCVGLATPKPGVFLSAIQHVLVLATPVEVGGLKSGLVAAPQPLRTVCWQHAPELHHCV